MFRPMLAALLTGAALTAQICAYTGSTDPGNGGATNGTLLLYDEPNGVRQHILIPGALFANVPYLIDDISVAVKIGWRTVHVDHLTIRMGHTSVNTLSDTFANNITSPLQDVLVADGYVLFQGVGPAWVPIGLQQPFQFLPGQGNLLIELVQQGTHVTGRSSSFSDMALPTFGVSKAGYFTTTLPTMANSNGVPPAMRICVDRADHLLLGTGCAAPGYPAPLLGITGEPALGSQCTLWLSGAPASSLAFLAFGFDNAQPYPLDLAGLGAPGCRQYFPISHTLALLASAAGVAQHTITVPPTPGLVGAIVLGQYATLVPGANTLGVLTSNYGRLLLGR